MQNKEKRGQVGIEYMIIIAFVSFAVIGILALAYLYSGQIKDNIKLNQIENFATQLVNSAESVFFAGEPSKTTIRIYLPKGIQSLQVNPADITIITNLNTGQNIRVYESRVPLYGTISATEGIKKLTLQAEATRVVIS